ncbi:histidine kinase [Nostoc ellipsosporum NOK]|nr:histidine kinase [Nostoc ellipsosporum NOK]
MEKWTINTLSSATKPRPVVPVNDGWFRFIVIPILGIGIPLISGMIHDIDLSVRINRLSFLYTTMIAFVVWQGNRYLHFSFRSYFDWYRKPVHKIVAMLLTICFYTIPLSVLLLLGWYRLFVPGPPDRQTIILTTLIILICVIFIAHIYETVFLVKASENEMLRNEQLERAKAEAELEALKNQIDPHFIFNSLNTLSHLIEEKPSRARQFNDDLAGVYRYLLQTKGRELVLLREEVQFLQNYFSLLKIRFEEGLQLNSSVPCNILDEHLVPPISLQLLVENAVKHNRFSDSHPLIITMNVRDNVLWVYNPILRKESAATGSYIGLNNLRDRYRLTTGMEIIVHETEESFEVGLPLLKIG